MTRFQASQFPIIWNTVTQRELKVVTLECHVQTYCSVADWWKRRQVGDKALITGKIPVFDWFGKCGHVPSPFCLSLCSRNSALPYFCWQ